MSNKNRIEVYTKPWLSGAQMLQADAGTNNAEVQFQFPFLARTIVVKNTSAVLGLESINVHFSSLADVLGDADSNPGVHVWQLSGTNAERTFNVITDQIFCSLTTSGAVSAGDADVQVFAELTALPTDSYFLTGSGITDDSILP